MDESLTISKNKKCRITSPTGTPVSIRLPEETAPIHGFKHFDFTDVGQVEITFESVSLDGSGVGGGIFIRSIADSATSVTFTNAIIKNCNGYGYGSGGGVSILDKQSTFTMNGGEISNSKHCVTTLMCGYGCCGMYFGEGTPPSKSIAAGYLVGGGGVSNQGTFNLNGGKITGNSCYYGGGGVFNQGAFNFIAGEISGNSTIKGEGGVFLHPEGAFNWNGGVIGDKIVYHTGTTYNLK